MEETKQVEQVAPESNAAQEAADFEKGFNQARGLSPPAEVKPVETAPKTEAAEEPPKVEEEKTEAPKEEVPPWKAEFDSVREKLEHRLRNAEGHIGNLTSQLKTAKEAAKAQAVAVTSAGGEAPTAAQIEQAVLSPEKLKALEEDYPDIAEPIKQLQAAVLRQQAELAKRPQFDGESMKTEITGSVEARIAAAESQVAAAEEFAYVRLKHPGWKKTVQTEEFRSWYEQQAPEVKALASSANGDDAVSMLDRFEDHRKKARAAAEKAEANKQRLARAETPRGVPTPPATTPSETEAFERGFNKVRSG